MWIYLDKLYLEGNNINRAYDVIRSYSEVNRKVECWFSSMSTSINFLRRLRRFFFYHSWCEGDAGEVKQIDGLCFLGALSRVFKSLIECDWQLYCQVTWEYLPLTWSYFFRVTESNHRETQDRSTLAVQGRTTWDKGHGSDLGARSRERGRGGRLSGGRAGHVIYCYCCEESDHTKYNCPLLEEK